MVSVLDAWPTIVGCTMLLIVVGASVTVNVSPIGVPELGLISPRLAMPLAGATASVPELLLLRVTAKALAVKVRLVLPPLSNTSVPPENSCTFLPAAVPTVTSDGGPVVAGAMAVVPS